MGKRGVLYMVWGSKPKSALARSQRTLRSFHPDLPIETIELQCSDPVEGLLQKATMFDKSPFEETLFLDADTVVLDRLDFGFERAAKYGLACAICEAPWARRYHKSIKGDLIEYNTGVLFFSRAAKPVFDRWKDLAPSTDSSILFPGANGTLRVMPHNDQGSFALAVESSGMNPFVLPLNWNFRPNWHKSFFGPIKIWHDYADVPPAIYQLSTYYRRPDAVIQYHER